MRAPISVRLSPDNREAHALLLAGDFPLRPDDRCTLRAMNPTFLSGLDRVRLSRIAAAAMCRAGGQPHGE